MMIVMIVVNTVIRSLVIIKEVDKIMIMDIMHT
jgi:hypothetical protein